MNKKIKIIIAGLICLIVIFLVWLTNFKLNYKSSDKELKGIINNVGIQVMYSPDTVYTEVYKENILNDIVTSVEYSIISDKEVLYGEVYVGVDGKLYISDGILKKNYLMLDEEIKTLYDAGHKNGLNCSVYAITKNGKLYHVGLLQPNISTMFADKIEIPSSITNFTNLTINEFIEGFKSGVVVLGADGIMYDALTGVKYIDNILNVLDTYIVYGTGVITDFNRNSLVNSKGEKYIAKIIISSYDPIKELEYKPNTIIVTSDNKLIYLCEKDKVYEYPVDVKLVGKDEEGLIVVVFENDEYITFKGFDNSKYYSIIGEEEIEENIEE